MCLDTMDTKVEFEVLKTCYSRRSAKLSKGRLRKLLHLSSKEGLKRWRTNIVKATLKKYIRCEQKRLLAKLVNQEHLLTDNVEDNRYMVTENIGRITQPLGAMAPKNTTQYLMDIVYDDMHIETSSNQFKSHQGSFEMSVSSASLSPGSACELSLDFQQRDFDEMYLNFGSC